MHIQLCIATYIILLCAYIAMHTLCIIYSCSDFYCFLSCIDPYVKVYLIYGGKRMKKWKTSVKKNTLVPVFNESFAFDVSRMDLLDISLEFSLMDYDRFTANDLVGVVVIGEHSPHESGKSHWDEIMASPKHRVSRWHSIRPPHHTGSRPIH